MIFRARQFEFDFPRPTLVMGIVNVTPDSFYDGGRFLDPAAAVEHGLDLASQGAEIIDIGGESTRPGVAAVHVVLDPGIGFGKTLEHNLQLLARLERLTNLNRPVLLGVSRKSFIGKLLGVEVTERMAAALACACLAVESGVSMIRTHDVADTLRMVRMTEAILARTG